MWDNLNCEVVSPVQYPVPHRYPITFRELGATKWTHSTAQANTLHSPGFLEACATCFHSTIEVAWWWIHYASTRCLPTIPRLPVVVTSIYIPRSPRSREMISGGKRCHHIVSHSWLEPLCLADKVPSQSPWGFLNNPGTCAKKVSRGNLGRIQAFILTMDGIAQDYIAECHLSESGKGLDWSKQGECSSSSGDICMIGTMTITNEPRHAIPSSCDFPFIFQTSPTQRRLALEMVVERKPKRKKVEVIIIRSLRAKNGDFFIRPWGQRKKGKQ